MSTEDAFFKIRPTKRSNPEARTTLDTVHQVQLNAMVEREKQVGDLEGEITELEEKLTAADDIQYEMLEQQIKSLQKEVEKRKGGNEVYDYFLNAGELLYQYYDVQERINNGEEGVSKNSMYKSKPGDILSSLQSAAEPGTVIANQPVGERLRRDKILETYLQKVDPEHARSGTEVLNDPYGECEDCQTEMIFSQNEALFTCPKCGYQEFVLIDSDKPSYKDPPREVSYYAYKRINHFNEWLAQFQAKESTEIPTYVYDEIVEELKKERISDYSSLKPSKIKEILRKLHYNKYYEHVPHILNRLNGENAPVMSREIEEKLRFMFKEIQPSFQTHCPKGRSNFLSYSYVLYKFCELLELDEYLPCFPLLKNRDKLYVQDKIWKLICQDLRWQYIRSI
jgi:predicted Zn-ribbon and HTH transcriptional regulator